ncbi:MAG: tyrosine--tRNA ligase [Gaiellaceae bacterium]
MSTLGVAELTRNAVHVLPAGALEAKLALGRPLRVKLGIDVTSPDIHVGRGIPLQRMRAFQDDGHVGVLIIGDYTTRIGDPSGRSTERPILTDEEIDRNAQTYVEQAYQLVIPEQTEVRFNSEWLAGLSFADVIQLTRMMTVAQVLERDDFAGRYAAGQPISVSELLYPLMQAYDSVAVEADVELGGTDQLYNLLAGREVMQAYGLEPQVVLTNPLLVSWDGEKMSSSVGNNIPLAARPEEQFGRAMRISDALLPEWYRLVLQSDVDPLAGDPLEAKLALARWIVARSHGEKAAVTAEAHFTRVVREGQAPDDVPELALPAGDPVHLPAVLAKAFGMSTSEARRLISQGGVKVADEPATELDIPRSALRGAVVQAGKRRFVRLVD